MARSILPSLISRCWSTEMTAICDLSQREVRFLKANRRGGVNALREERNQAEVATQALLPPSENLRRWFSLKLERRHQHRKPRQVGTGPVTLDFITPSPKMMQKNRKLQKQKLLDGSTIRGAIQLRS